MNTTPVTEGTPEKRVEATLTQKAVTGTAWSTASTVGRQLLQIASATTVARALGPGAYGIMGMAALLLAFVLGLRDLGTGTAIVQRLEVSDRLLSSLFWLNFSIGLALGGAVAAGSPLVAQFFHTPLLVPILCTLSVSVLMTSCGIVHNSILLREMRYRSLASVDLSAAILSYLVALGCAYSGFGVWSLVWANVANAFVASLLYWVAAIWRPKFVFDRDEVRSVARFSLNLSGFGLVNFFARNADNIVVGRMRGQAELGNYQMAYNLMLTPISNISSIVAQITLPAFSRIQVDDARFRSAYVRQSMMVGLLTFPIIAGMGVLANPLIHAVLGAKWVGAIVVFQILAPVGLLQSVATLGGQIFTAKGRTDLMFRWTTVATIVLVASFIAGGHWGAVGVATAYGLAYILLLFYPGLWMAFRVIGLSVTDYLMALLPQFLITATMVLCCLVWRWLLHLGRTPNAWVELVSTTLIGATVYVGILITLRPPDGCDGGDSGRIRESLCTEIHCGNPKDRPLAKAYGNDVKVNEGVIQKQIDYYNQRWQLTPYANLYCLERCVFFLEALLSLGLDQPRICDLGSGTGWLSGVLSNFGPVVGVELSPEAVKLASARYPAAQFVAADATAWEPAEHSFDVIVSQEVLEHIPDKAAYLRVAHQALKPGGYLLMTTPNLDTLNAIPDEERKRVWEIQPVELPVNRRQLNQLLDKAGFQVLATSSVVDQQGRNGLHRLVNSAKLRAALEGLGLLATWKKMLLRRDFGMYLTTKARAL